MLFRVRGYKYKMGSYVHTVWVAKHILLERIGRCCLHKAVTTAASVLVMDRKYPLYVLENVHTTGLSARRGDT
jgi:hypothetical protein